MIYVNIPGNLWVCMSDMTLPYIANDEEVECIAKTKIEEIESV